MARPIKRLHAALDAVKELRRRPRPAASGARGMERANSVLPRLGGAGVAAAAGRPKTTSKRVSPWPGRFERPGRGGLDDKPGRGRKPSIPKAKAARAVAAAARPPQGKTRGSIRSMSRRAGVAPGTVQPIWPETT